MGYKRRIRQPLILSDGIQLPAKAHIEFPIVEIQRENTENADTFDGLRFYKLRQNPDDAHKYQFASTSRDSLHFGHGQHSCPGRFTASIEIKMIIASLLLDYDMRFPESYEGRPKSIPAFEYIFPDPWAKILFKRRETARPLQE